jgi:omega-amidase
MGCRKTHLFDICIPGKISFQESKTLSAGQELTCITTRFGTLGVGICYDLRFPEMAMIYRQRGADILVYPGAFNMTTGPVHWRLLQQSRALDNQLYVISCSPARDPDFTYVAWGHSMVVGPFGEVLGELEQDEGILFQEVDLTQLKQRRENMPLEAQRRQDLYQLVDRKPG